MGGKIPHLGSESRRQAHQIEPELHQALDNARYWIEHGSYAADELAVRLHHRLVVVHPFPNGNGRWSRLAADTLIVRRTGTRFTWGRSNLLQAMCARTTSKRCMPPTSMIWSRSFASQGRKPTCNQSINEGKFSEGTEGRPVAADAGPGCARHSHKSFLRRRA